MWGSAYNTYGYMPQQDMQSNNWLNKNLTSGMSNPYGISFGNYFSGASNPFAGQTYAAASAYQPYSGLGYQYRGW